MTAPIPSNVMGSGEGEGSADSRLVASGGGAAASESPERLEPEAVEAAAVVDSRLAEVASGGAEVDGAARRDAPPDVLGAASGRAASEVETQAVFGGGIAGGAVTSGGEVSAFSFANMDEAVMPGGGQLGIAGGGPLEAAGEPIGAGAAPVTSAAVPLGGVEAAGSERHERPLLSGEVG